MTKEQKYFQKYLQLLRSYRYILAQDITTSRVRREAEWKVQDIQNGLWESVKNYARSIIKDVINDCMPNDAEEDMLQACALMFFEKLNAYDPSKSTPTTYFKPYFYEVIHGYARDCVHYTQHEANLYAKLNSAFEDLYKKRHHYPTPEELSEETGLTVKMCRRFWELENRRVFSSIDPLHSHLRARNANPYWALFIKEREASIHNAITVCLTDEERTILLTKINFSGKQRSFPEVSATLGMPMKDVKKAYYNATSKLSNAVKL